MPIIDLELVKQYKMLHNSECYGVSGAFFYDVILECILCLQPKSILDYGCGQNGMHEQVSVQDVCFDGYDPAIDKLSVIMKSKYDFVINTDVLEHIPEDDIDDVLSHIQGLSSNVFFNISTRPAKKLLPNGQNAHCTVWESEKWFRMIRRHFRFCKLLHEDEYIGSSFITWDSPRSSELSSILESQCKNIKSV